MDEKHLKELTMNRIKKKFYGHDKLISKYVPQIPMSAEREYIRLTNQYMRILKEELESELPKLKEVYKHERDMDVKMRKDSATDLHLAITDFINKIMNNVAVRIAKFGLRRKLESLANLNRKLTLNEWKKAIKSTLGISILDDYYLGEFYAEYLRIWVDENVNLIKTIPEDSLGKMKDIIYDGFENGKTLTVLMKEIQREYGISKRRARFIARDQTGKLFSDIHRAQQEDAGIKEYIWRTTGDSVVRDSHRELNGKKFKWSDPPENSDGRKCHPGKDYGCRCVALAVFPFESLNLPIDTESEYKITEMEVIKK